MLVVQCVTQRNIRHTASKGCVHVEHWAFDGNRKEHLRAPSRDVDVVFHLLSVASQKASTGGSVHGERANFTRLVLGCIEASKQARKYSLESQKMSKAKFCK